MKVKFKLSEEKKHSGKYVEVGTEDDQYPNYMYFRRKWFEGDLPKNVILEVTPE